MTDTFIQRLYSSKVGITQPTFSIDCSDPDPDKWYAHGLDTAEIERWNTQHQADIAARKAQPQS